MTEELINTPLTGDEVTSDDKLWAMLSWIPWVGWVLAIISLLIEPQKTRKFIRFHAVQALAASVVLWIISFIISLTGVGVCIAPLLGLVTIYPAIQANKGEWFEIPWLTDFCKGQGWI